MRLLIVTVLCLLARCAPAPAAAPILSPYTAFAWAAGTPNTGHVQPMPCLSQVWSDPAAVAKQMSAIPEGRRVGLAFCAGDPLWGIDALSYNAGSTMQPSLKPMQSPWLDKGGKAFAAAQAAFYARYFAAGGPTPDFVAFDEERVTCGWNTGAGQAAAIQADPRWAALVKPYGPVTVSPGGYSPQFDDAMRALLNAALRDGIAPTRTRISNFGDCIVPSTVRCLDGNGWQIFSTGTAGGWQSPIFYGGVGQIKYGWRNDGSNPDFANDKLAIVIWQADCAKATAMSKEPSLPWFAYRSFGSLANSRYWDEMVIQCLLSSGTTNCLTWNPGSSAADNAALESDMAGLQTACGNTPTIVPIGHDPVLFSAPVLASGVIAGSHRVYRVSVSTTRPATQPVTVTLPGEAASTIVSVPTGATGVWVER